MSTTSPRYQVDITADPTVPVITMTRDFDATPAQLMRAHTDADLFARWVGPNGIENTIVEWDARTGGCWRYVSRHDGQEYGFHGSFHDVGDDRIVQTFTFDGMPDSVSLETLWFEDLGDGRTRVVGTTMFFTPEERDGMVHSGMEGGMNESYAALDRVLAAMA